MPEDWQNGGFGLYIHWPFCQAKCPYCDFNSHVVREIDHDRWLKAYLNEIDRYASLLPDRVLNTVFFGGGTPSLMQPEVVYAIIDRIRRTWPIGNDPEITLEANPGSVEAGRFRGFADAGITRVSMGAQALNDRDLQRLGRLHSVAEFRRAFDIARNAFERVSFDLIYARQDQTLEDWRAELNEALSIAADHLSLYQLTIEPNTAFGARYEAGKLRGLPPDDDAADMYMLTQDLCDAAGLPGYEVSNHARIGAESRHNLIYWNYGDYIGIGPGAHGRLSLDGIRYATESWSNPERWLHAVHAGKAEKIWEAIPAPDQADEFLMMGLRLRGGVDTRRYQTLAGKALNSEIVTHLEEIGMVEMAADQLRTTPAGRILLNAVLKALLTGGQDPA